MKRLKRNAINISRVFYKMSDFWANELFVAEPFIMKVLGGQFQEKFVRILLLNWGAVGQKGRAKSWSQGPGGNSQ